MRLFMSPRIAPIFVALGGLVGAVCGVALNWDGSAYLFDTLDSRAPFVAHGRLVDVVTEAPTLFAQNFTDRLAILRLVFGISYLAIPAVALLASYVVVRQKRKGLFVWPVLAICVATLPGQVNPSSEALQAAQLVWPALLAAIVGLDRHDWLAWLAVVTTGVYVALAHPFGVLLLGGVLIVGLVYRHRSMAVLAGLLVVTALLNTWLTADPYQGNRITVDVVSYGFDKAIAGAPLLAMVSSAFGAVMIAIADRTKQRTLLGVAGVACQVLAIGALIRWANDPLAWNGAIEFRTFAAVAIIPVALVAVMDGWREPLEAAPWRQLAALVASAGFVLIMAVQGLSVKRLDSSMVGAMHATTGSCVSQEGIIGGSGSVLDAWATPYRSLVFGDRKATKIVIWGDRCSLLTEGGLVPVDNWGNGPLDASGWFDLSGLATKP
jgi:hypothetical protein